MNPHPHKRILVRTFYQCTSSTANLIKLFIAANAPNSPRSTGINGVHVGGDVLHSEAKVAGLPFLPVSTTTASGQQDDLKTRPNRVDAQVGLWHVLKETCKRRGKSWRGDVKY